MRNATLLLLPVFFVACSDTTSLPSSPVASDPGRLAAKSVTPGPSLLDARDGNSYPTIVVGGKTWMAKNLGYDTLADAGAWVSGGNPSKLTDNGQLYDWKTAMGTDSGIFAQCDVSLPERGICPVGWHVPSKEEWTSLFDTLGGAWQAGRKLKSDRGWGTRLDGRQGGGIDSVGFAAMPAGYRSTGDQGFGTYGHTPDDSAFFDMGARALFWTRTNSVPGSCWSAWGVSMQKDYDEADFVINPRKTAMSVRCVKNN